MDNEIDIISLIDYFYKIVKIIIPTLRIADECILDRIFFSHVLFNQCDVFVVNVFSAFYFSRIGMNIKHVTTLEKEGNESEGNINNVFFHLCDVLTF